MKSIKNDRNRALKNLVKVQNAPWIDKLSMHQDDLKTIEKYQRNGKVGIAWSTTDCDMCQSTGVSVIPATITHFRSKLNKLLDAAEGPVDWSITYPKEQKPTFRDLIAEAHENGHPHIVRM